MSVMVDWSVESLDPGIGNFVPNVFADVVDQTVEMFNFQTGQFEQVGVDMTVINAINSKNQPISETIQLQGNLARFVDGKTSEVRARLSYNRPHGTKTQFNSRTDRFIWDISE